MPKFQFDIESLEKSYSILFYPKYLLFIFESDNYSDLINYKNRIIKLLQLELKSPLYDIFELLSGICMVPHDYFTCLIIKIEKIQPCSNQFDNNVIYYHDRMKYDCCFTKYKNINDLFLNNINVVPYIIIFCKKSN